MAFTPDQQTIASLRAQLREAQDTLDAIRNGEVDAVVVGTAGDGQIFTLQNADRPYRFLVEQMKEGAITLSEDGVILYGNPRFAEILGLPLEKIVGSNFRHFFSPSDHARLALMMEAQASANTRGEFALQSADQQTVPVFISLSEVVTDTSELRLYGAIITDLSEQRLMDERLRQTQKMEAVGQLTGGLAHDFNNLLQAISGNLNLIKLKPDDPVRVIKWAENGLQAAQRGAKLTSQLLAFSRLQQIDLKPVDATVLVLGMSDLLKHTLGPLIEVQYQLAPGTISIFGDQTQLELAILNLAINARDAMPDGGQLTIATATRSIASDVELLPGDYFELSVSDTGSGMTEHVRARAFDPFFTTKSVGQGTGLGLAQVYGIARQAGGTVRIQSEPGQGTCITMLLQLSQQTDSGTASLEHAVAPQTGNGIKVLVVDDDDDVRSALVETLIILGYSVSQAADGLAGLEVMAETSPDLLIIDYAMPRHNGAEIVKMARAQGYNMPVIFASGYSDQAALNEAVDVKANLILKPFTIATLMQELQKVLAQSAEKAG